MKIVKTFFKTRKFVMNFINFFEKTVGAFYCFVNFTCHVHPLLLETPRLKVIFKFFRRCLFSKGKNVKCIHICFKYNEMFVKNLKTIL